MIPQEERTRYIYPDSRIGHGWTGQEKVQKRRSSVHRDTIVGMHVLSLRFTIASIAAQCKQLRRFLPSPVSRIARMVSPFPGIDKERMCDTEYAWLPSALKLIYYTEVPQIEDLVARTRGSLCLLSSRQIHSSGPWISDNCVPNMRPADQPEKNLTKSSTIGSEIFFFRV